MTHLLDAGAFVAIERGDRDAMALLKHERLAGRTPLTHGGIVGQVWRSGSGRQANLGRLLPGIDVRPLDELLGKRAGVLLALAGQSDVVDAALVALGDDGDSFVTSDPYDLSALAQAADLHVDLIQV